MYECVYVSAVSSPPI